MFHIPQKLQTTTDGQFNTIYPALNFLRRWLGMGSPKTVYTFIDNSNLFIEAQRMARKTYAYDHDEVARLRIDFGNLLKIIVEDRKVGASVLVGSRPPDSDSLWAALKRWGISPRIFDRSYHTGREKGVDAEMINAIRDTMEEVSVPQTIAVVAGDADYISTLERAITKGWEVEIYFWNNASRDLKNLSRAHFIEIDQYFPKISFQAKSSRTPST